MKTVYIVVPCYNEEAVLYETAAQLMNVLSIMKEAGYTNDKSRIMFVDDGSKDRTWSIIEELSTAHTQIGGIKLAHNAGHQNALMSGLMSVKSLCDCAISIDADLQDDVQIIPEMVNKYIHGAHVVYGVRNRRDTDTFFKRTTALGFYKLMNVMGVNVMYNHADYRLMSREALEGLAQFPERNLFLRGVVSLIGYSSDVVYYDRHERFAGESKYPLKKMLSFAVDGITSFSITPIRIITGLGAIACIFAVVMAVYAIVQKCLGNSNAGWSSLMCSIWFLGGVQILGLGLIGEYIGKIYKEVKRRPRYIIEKIINH